MTVLSLRLPRADDAEKFPTPYGQTDSQMVRNWQDWAEPQREGAPLHYCLPLAPLGTYTILAEVKKFNTSCGQLHDFAEIFGFSIPVLRL